MDEFYGLAFPVPSAHSMSFFLSVPPPSLPPSLPRSLARSLPFCQIAFVSFMAEACHELG